MRHPGHRELRAFFSCMAWRAIPGHLSKRKRRLAERRSAGMGQMSGTCVQGMRQCACAHKCQGVEASRCSLTRGQSQN